MRKHLSQYTVWSTHGLYETSCFLAFTIPGMDDTLNINTEMYSKQRHHNPFDQYQTCTEADNIIFWNVTPYSLVQTYSRFGGTHLNLYQATQHHIPQDMRPSSHGCSGTEQKLYTFFQLLPGF